MSETDQQRRPAISLEVVDIHLDYLRGDMARVLAAVERMATKDDIKALESRMQSFVTRSDFDALAAQVKSGSVESTFSSWMTAVRNVAATVAAVLALGGVVAAIVHWSDRVPGVAK